MKIIFFIGSLVLTIFSCKAQVYPAEIIPVENHLDVLNNSLTTEIPDGAYFKDVNHVLDKYVGTWIGNWDNRTYELHIIEKTYHSVIRPGLKVDQLYIRYKITDTNGTIIASTLNSPDSSPYIIQGGFVSADGTYYELRYVGVGSACGDRGDLYINTLNNDTQMRVILEVDKLDVNCPNGWTDPIFPTPEDNGALILTKQ